MSGHSSGGGGVCVRTSARKNLVAALPKRPLTAAFPSLIFIKHQLADAPQFVFVDHRSRRIERTVQTKQPRASQADAATGRPKPLPAMFHTLTGIASKPQRWLLFHDGVE